MKHILFLGVYYFNIVYCPHRVSHRICSILIIARNFNVYFNMKNRKKAYYMQN